MLSIFRTNQLILGIFLLGYAFLLRFWLFLAAGPRVEIPEYDLISGWLWTLLKDPFWLPALGTILLLWIQALLINALVARNRLATEINLFPGLFYLLISSALPAFQEFSPIHVANTFLILALGQIYRIYKQNRCMDFLFNAGLWVGMAGLCYPPYILFLLPFLVGLNILRAFRLKEWLAVLIGGFLPLFWLLVLGFLNDRLADRWATWTAHFDFLDVSWKAMGEQETIGLAIFGLLIITVILNYNSNIKKTIIEVRKKMDILYWLLLFGLICTAFSSEVTMAHLLTISLPSGMLLSFMFTRMSRSTSELLHLFLLIGVLVLHYLTYAGVI